MNTKFVLLAASALVMLQPTLSFAELEKSENEARSEAASSGEISKDAKEAWKDIKHDAKEVSKEVKAFFIGEDESIQPKEMTYLRVSSASGIIGSNVFNYKDVRVGTVKDIIVNSSGQANMVIIADGEFPGFDGKLVAFPFADITKQEDSGDVIAPISEKAIDRAVEFNYAKGTEKSKVRYMPKGGYSVSKILSGNILSSTNKKVGVIEDIYFKGGNANMIIIGFDKVMGMGGKKVVTEYYPTTIINDKNNLDIKLSAKQSSSLAHYKSVVNE